MSPTYIPASNLIPEPVVNSEPVVDSEPIVNPPSNRNPPSNLNPASNLNPPSNLIHASNLNLQPDVDLFSELNPLSNINLFLNINLQPLVVNPQPEVNSELDVNPHHEVNSELDVNPHHEVNSDCECHICFDNIDRERLCNIHCDNRHTFCLKCLKQLFVRSLPEIPKCPDCRVLLNDNDIVKIVEKLSLFPDEDIPLVVHEPVPQENDQDLIDFIIQDLENEFSVPQNLDVEPLNFLERAILEESRVHRRLQNSHVEPLNFLEQAFLAESRVHRRLQNSDVEPLNFLEQAFLEESRGPRTPPNFLVVPVEPVISNQLQEAIVPRVQSVFNFSFSKFKTVRNPGEQSYKIHYMCKMQFASDSFESAFEFITGYLPRKYIKYLTYSEFVNFCTIVHPNEFFSYNNRFCHLITLDTSTNQVSLKSTDVNLLQNISSEIEFIHISNGSGSRYRNKKTFEFSVLPLNEDPSVLVPRYNEATVKLKVIDNLRSFRLVDLSDRWFMQVYGV